MICPNCKAKLKDTAKYCGACGSAIPRCPTCGKLLTKKLPFCTEDGTPIPEEILELIPSEIQEPADNQPADKLPKSFCVKCGKPCNYGEKLCESCKNEDGLQQSKADLQSVSGQKPPKPPEKKRIGLLVFIIIAAVLLAILAGLVTYACVTSSLPFIGSKTVSEEYHDSDRDKDSDDRDEDNEDNDYDEDDENYEDEDKETDRKTAKITAEDEDADEDEEAETEERALIEEADNTPEETEELSDIEYFILNSDKMYFTEDYFADFDANMCRLARNGIYAYMGRKFKDSSLQSYFEQYDWYSPRINPDDFAESMLNQYQIANRDLIVNYESKKGYN